MRVLLVLVPMLLLGGCAANWGTGDVGHMLFNDTVERLRDENRRKIAKVQVNMPRAEVEALMGHDRAGGGLFDVLHGRFQHLEARNPMREETVRGADGAAYQVVYYYTDLRTRDNKITDDELTPIIFRDARVVGIGAAFLNDLAPRLSKAG